MLHQLLDALEDTLNKTPRRLRIVESTVIGDGVEVVESGFGPDYFSHRPIRFLASVWVTTRPSSTARSPKICGNSPPASKAR